MKVHELIAKLQQLPQQLDVVVYDEDGNDLIPVKSVLVKHEPAEVVIQGW